MMNRISQRTGFTLVEILIVVAIISLLAFYAVPNMLRARQDSRITKVASDLKAFGKGFHMYALTEGRFPADAHLTLPPGMDVYISQDDWSNDALGGVFNWEGPAWGEGGSYPYAGISIFGTTASIQELTALDTTLDNGDLNTGIFRQTPNGRYTYIIEE